MELGVGVEGELRRRYDLYEGELLKCHLFEGFITRVPPIAAKLPNYHLSR